MTETTETEISRTIDPTDRAEIVARVEKMNRRAARLGCAPLVLTFGDEYVETIRDEATGLEQTIAHLPLTLTGRVALDGWSIVASVDLDGDAPYVVRSVPGRDGRAEWAYTADYCDHCHRANVGRSKIVYVENVDGRVAQVGATCLRDFLGHSLAALTFVYDALEDLDREIEIRTPRPDFTLLGTLTATAAAIREYGWTSKSAAAAYNEAAGHEAKEATSGIVARYLFARTAEAAAKIISEITDADRTKAQTAIEWTQTISETEENEYLRNLRIVGSHATVTGRNHGLACSIIAAADRAETQRVEREQAKAERTPVPVTEKRITITGVVLGFRTVESEYGVTEKMRVLDDRGFVVYGTVPTALAGTYVHDEQGARIVDEAGVGDRVRFDARVEVSRDDETFGFYSRPTKAALLEEVNA